MLCFRDPCPDLLPGALHLRRASDAQNAAHQYTFLVCSLRRGGKQRFHRETEGSGGTKLRHRVTAQVLDSSQLVAPFVGSVSVKECCTPMLPIGSSQVIRKRIRVLGVPLCVHVVAVWVVTWGAAWCRDQLVCYGPSISWRSLWGNVMGVCCFAHCFFVGSYIAAYISLPG